MHTLNTKHTMDTAIRAAARVLVNITACDFAINYGIYTAYALREYRGDIAADIARELWGVDHTITDTERQYMSDDRNWPRLEGFVVFGKPTGKL
jgi:hypothetical protein